MSIDEEMTESLGKDAMAPRRSLEPTPVEHPSEETRDTDSPDLRAVALRALEFQGEYLRRRWATYYAFWACAVATYFLVPFLLGFTAFSTLPLAVRLLTQTGLDLVTTVVAVADTLFVWGLAERTSALRSAAGGRPSLVGPRNLVRFAIVLAIVLAAVAISTHSNLASLVLGDTALLVLALLLVLHLHRAFRPVPPEGWLAVAAFIAAAALSYFSVLLLSSTLGHEIVWSAAVVVWIGCAAYARYGIPFDSEGFE